MLQGLEVNDLDKIYGLIGFFNNNKGNLPKHSNFLVAAAVYFFDKNGKELVQYGINSETCNLENSFCAERTALVSLRSKYSDFKISAVYIAATSQDPVTPGALCREMLVENVDSLSDCRVISVAEGFDPSKSNSFLVTTLSELYPYPCIYRNKQRSLLKDIGATSLRQHLKEPCLVDLYGKCIESANVEQPDEKLYPINYVAGVLFSDSTIAIARSDKLLEFGCSLDALGKLAHPIETKSKDSIRPSYLLYCDQFGNLHAPFSKYRAWLCEKGFGDVKIVIHGEPEGSIYVVDAAILLPLAPVQIMNSLDLSP
jgi:cytidine deaminase